MASQIMDDAEVAAMFHIAKRTLQRRLKNPRAGEIDLNEAYPEIMGGKRFWLRSEVERVAGIGKSCRGSSKAAGVD